MGRGISDLLVTMLVKDGTYSVIERKSLDKILGEQNFSNSDRANPASAAKIGKILGVDAIIVGSVTQFGNDTKNTGVGGVGAGLGKVGLGGFSRKESKAVVGIDSRIVDIDTAEMLAVAEGKGESKRTSTSMTGGGGAWGGFGAGGVNFGASDFQNTIIGEATKAATEMLSANLIAGNAKLVVRTVVVEGLVAAADGGQIIINVGGQVGAESRRPDERRAPLPRDQGPGDRQSDPPHDRAGRRHQDHRRRRSVGRRNPWFPAPASKSVTR